MQISKLFKIFILCCFLTSSLLFGQNAEHLKKEDISRIMDQIFSEHLGQKQIDEQILKNSFKVYIDQFDPDRTYLLQSEVSPYLQINGDEIKKLIKQYKEGDFTSFEKLNNDVIQKSILRAREYRKELLKNQEEIYSAAEKLKSTKDNEWIEPDLDRPFSQNDAQLKDRIRSQMVNFIQAEQKRYGNDQIQKYKNKLLVLFDEALTHSEDNYLYRDPDGKPYTAVEVENAFVLHVLKSLASSLDAHTAFFTNSEAYDMKVRLEKEFAGIGVVLQQTPEGVVISSLVEGGPASKSGQVFANDRIVQIDGKVINGLSLSDVMAKMRGTKDTSVELVLSRSIDESGKQINKEVKVHLKREPIAVKGERVDVNYEKFGNGIIGMITLHSFYQGEDGTGSETDIRNAIKELDKKGNLRGLIIDMRENSGGFLTQAVKVAGLFITNGVVVISKYSDGDERVYRDMEGNESYKGPLVILTSKATASAAEIVAQALQDYGIALIVGDERTYGKGTIQSQTVTGPENSATNFFKVTVGKYYTVSGKTPQLQGVKADVVVPGPFSKEHIGEEYLDHPLKSDTIKPEYKDDLSDVDPGLRSWYMKYYIPKVQQKMTIWRNMLPILKKNSAYRLENNKNYQMFLKQLNSGEVDLALFKQTGEGVKGKDQTNYGHEDLQMQEALNIVKDMIYLQNQDRQIQLAGHAEEVLQSVK